MSWAKSLIKLSTYEVEILQKRLGEIADVTLGAEDYETVLRLEGKAELKGETPDYEGTWNAVCLADMGETGAAFVALPQIPPRNVTWTKVGKWVHVAKIGFEKYFLYKMRNGTSEPIYEKYILGMLGIERLKDVKRASKS